LTCSDASIPTAPTQEGLKDIDFILRDRGTVKTRGTTKSTDYYDGQGERDSATHLHIVNAYTSDLDVTIELRDVTYTLAYGDTLVENLGRNLDLNELYNVSVGNDSYTGTVHTVVPNNSDVFLITDVSVNGRLRHSLSVWSRNKALCDGCFWMLSYNGFSHSGLDVLLFDASKVRTGHHSLLRVGKLIESFHTDYVQLEQATYELKVVRHDIVQDIDDFKNTPSLTPPLFIYPQANERYYGTIIGIYNKLGKFRPDYKSIPPFPTVKPVPYPPTHVVVINAFPHNCTVSINFPNNYHFKNLAFGGVSVAEFGIKQYDIYQIKLEQGPRYKAHVHVAVPYIDSECVFVVDMGLKGNPENLLLCRRMGYDHAGRVHLDHGLIMTYHALNNYSTPVDVLLFDSSKLNDPNQHSLYNIANGALLGNGIPSSLPAGRYKVKVVPKNTVSNSAEFDKAQSLLPVHTIRVNGGSHYYLVLSGIYGSKRYQPRPIVHETIELKSTDTIMYTEEETGDVSGSADLIMVSDSDIDDTGSSAVRWTSVSIGLVSLLTVLVAELLW
jgi:hypothetical protein